MVERQSAPSKKFVTSVNPSAMEPNIMARRSILCIDPNPIKNGEEPSWFLSVFCIFRRLGVWYCKFGFIAELCSAERYKIRAEQARPIQDIETAVAVWVFTYLVSLYLVTCISPKNCNFMFTSSAAYTRSPSRCRGGDAWWPAPGCGRGIRRWIRPFLSSCPSRRA